MPANPTTISLTTTSETDISLINRFVGSLASSGGVEVRFELKDLKLFEIELDSVFRGDLLAYEQAYEVQRRGLAPRVIVRAYEGIVSYEVRKQVRTSAEVWDSVVSELSKVGARQSGEGVLSLSGRDPVDVAYETLAMSYVAPAVAAGGSSEIVLEPMPAVAASSEPGDMGGPALQPAPTDVRYVLLGNGRYDSPAFENLRLVEPTLNLAGDVFATAGARPLLNEPTPTHLTSDDLNAKIDQILREARQSRPDLLVVYYVVHAVSGRDGEVFLVMQDYRGDPAEDLGEDLMLGSGRRPVRDPSSPAGGTNGDSVRGGAAALRERVVARRDPVVARRDLAATTPPRSPRGIAGLVPVSTIHARLEQAGVPFVILVDAYYEHGESDRLRIAYGLTRRGDYFGPDSVDSPDRLPAYVESLRQFGAARYLKSSNPIVLSAAPGTAALAVSDPRRSWRSDALVAPLARRAFLRLESAMAAEEEITWGEFISSIVDVRSVDRATAQGSASWSDFAALDKLPMLRRASGGV